MDIPQDHIGFYVMHDKDSKQYYIEDKERPYLSELFVLAESKCVTSKNKVDILVKSVPFLSAD